MLEDEATPEDVWKFSYNLHRRVPKPGGSGPRWPSLQSFKDYFNRGNGQMTTWPITPLTEQFRLLLPAPDKESSNTKAKLAVCFARERVDALKDHSLITHSLTHTLSLA